MYGYVSPKQFSMLSVNSSHLGQNGRYFAVRFALDVYWFGVFLLSPGALWAAMLRKLHKELHKTEINSVLTTKLCGA